MAVTICNKCPSPRNPRLHLGIFFLSDETIFLIAFGIVLQKHLFLSAQEFLLYAILLPYFDIPTCEVGTVHFTRVSRQDQQEDSQLHDNGNARYFLNNDFF